jgi:LCP family protein required for cell wall assembly
VPILLAAGGLLLAYFLFGRELRNQLFSSTFLTGLLVADVVLLAWRAFAVAQAGLRRPRIAAGPGHPPTLGHRPPATVALVIVLLLAVVAMHGWAGAIIRSLDTTLAEVFSGGTHGQPEEGGGTDAPLNVPDYRWDGTDRISFLLLGVDAGPGREEALTDTILVVSIDPVAKTAVMISVPRDTGYVPLPDRSVYRDGLYPRKINQLTTDASANPALWCPDMPETAAEQCGLRTLQRAIGLYLGVPLQYSASVDLVGFAEMIDAVGGLTLCLDGRLVDETYAGPTWPQRGIVLEAGCGHYDGAHALAYARIRKGTMTMPDGTVEEQNDFLRAARQQEVLLELRKEMAQLDLVFELPQMVQAVGRTVSTDFPRDRAGDLASLLPLITGPAIERVVLGYPEFVDPPVAPLVNYLLIPRREDVRVEMERLFGADSLQGWYLAGHDDGPPS